MRRREMDPSCLTLGQHFHQLWATKKHFENWSRRDETRISADDTLFGGL